MLLGTVMVHFRCQLLYLWLRNRGADSPQRPHFPLKPHFGLPVQKEGKGILRNTNYQGPGSHPFSLSYRLLPHINSPLTPKMLAYKEEEGSPSSTHHSFVFRPSLFTSKTKAENGQMHTYEWKQWRSFGAACPLFWLRAQYICMYELWNTTCVIWWLRVS